MNTTAYYPDDEDTQPAAPAGELSDGERLFLAWFNSLPPPESARMVELLRTGSTDELVAAIARLGQGAQQRR